LQNLQQHLPGKMRELYPCVRPDNLRVGPLKALKGILVALGLLGSVYAVFLLLWPGDVVTRHYANIAEARADEIFGRGWLPDILPPSSHDIKTSSNLDINTSWGEFAFTPTEYAQFAARIHAPSVMDNGSFSTKPEDLAEKRAKGFSINVHTEDNTTWVFHCKPTDGYCEYEMWLHRG
jgi:hypothetical protein